MRKPRLGLILFGILLGCGLVEGTLRLQQAALKKLYVPAQGLYCYDPVLGWRFTPNYQGVEKNVDFLKGYRIRINREGFRDREFSAEKPAGKKRILVLGDSFTFGTGVEQEETFPKVLERRLGQEAFNWGVAGYSTDQELLLLEKEGLRYRPDLVILALYLGNDLMDNLLPYPSEADRAKPFFVLEGTRLNLKNVPVPQARKDPGPRSQGLTQLLTRSLLVSETAKILIQWKPLQPLAARLGSMEDSTTQEQELRLAQALLARMREWTLQHDSRLFVVMVPHLSQIQRFSPRTAASNALATRLLAACRELKIDAVDLTPILKHRAQEGEALYFPRERHWNALGHKRAAEIIVKALGSGAVKE